MRRSMVSLLLKALLIIMVFSRVGFSDVEMDTSWDNPSNMEGYYEGDLSGDVSITPEDIVAGSMWSHDVYAADNYIYATQIPYLNLPANQTVKLATLTVGGESVDIVHDTQYYIEAYAGNGGIGGGTLLVHEFERDFYQFACSRDFRDEFEPGYWFWTEWEPPVDEQQAAWQQWCSEQESGNYTEETWGMLVDEEYYQVQGVQGEYWPHEVAQVVCYVEPEPGYYFVEWVGPAVDRGIVWNPYDPLLEVYGRYWQDGYTHMTATAVFAPSSRTLTVSTAGHGSATGSGTYEPGTEVSVEATADEHYHFVEWTGTAVDVGKVTDVSAPITTVTIEADYTLVAHFAIDQHVLSLSSSAGGSITSPGEGEFTYDYNTAVTLAAQADEPLFEFSHFEGNLWASYSPYVWTVKQDCGIEAIFCSTLDVIYVDANIPEGQYENGTNEYPFDTISEALGVTASGSTVVIRSGTYTENLELSNKSLTLTGVDINDVNDWSFPVVQGVEGPVLTVFNCHDANGVILNGLVLTQGNGFMAGGIECRGSVLTLSNCLLMGNRANRDHVGGGALRAFESQVNLNNCTLADNFGGFNGAGVLVDSNSVVMVSDSILWNNESAEFLCDESSVVWVEYSDVNDPVVGEGNLSVNPEFISPGQWISSFDPNRVIPVWYSFAIWNGTGDYHLAATSPCIDAGDPNAACDREPDPNELGVNMGAYGNTPEATVIPDE